MNRKSCGLIWPLRGYKSFKKNSVFLFVPAQYFWSPCSLFWLEQDYKLPGMRSNDLRKKKRCSMVMGGTGLTSVYSLQEEAIKFQNDNLAAAVSSHSRNLSRAVSRTVSRVPSRQVSRAVSRMGSRSSSMNSLYNLGREN
jgi:hypothetical protein